MKVEYSSNNSGGDWWLKDKHWKALEDAGWCVAWGGLDFCGAKHGPLFLHRPSRAPNTCDDCKGHRPYTSYADAVTMGDNDRWLGALARNASKDFPSLADAIRDWEKATGLDASDNGCGCCGPPHSFSATDDAGKWAYASGDDIAGVLYPESAGKTLRQLAAERDP